MRFSHPLLLALMATLMVTLDTVRAATNDGDRQYRFARGLYARAQWDAAAKEFEAFLQQNPEYPEAAKVEFYLGEALAQQRRYAEAGKRFQRYSDLQPNGAYRKLAMFRLAEGEFLQKLPTAQKRLEAFSKTYSDDRLNGLVLTYRGQTALQQGEPQEAERLFRESLERFPKEFSPDANRMGLARALEALDRTEEAERYYVALAAKSDNATAIEARYRLASLRYAQQRYDAALETFTELDGIPESNAWAASAGLGKAWTIMKLGRNDAAARIFEQLCDHPSAAIQARYWLGLCHKAEKNWTEAAEAFLAGVEGITEEQAKGITPGSAGNVTKTAILFHLGDTQLAAGKLNEARKHLEQAIAAGKPGDLWLNDAERALVQSSLRLKDYDRARTDAERFLGEQSENRVTSDLLRLLARSQLEQNEFGAAEQALSRLADAKGNGSDSVEDAYLLALCYQGQERYESALQTIRTVLDKVTGKLASDAKLVEASLLIALTRYDDALAVLAALQPASESPADSSQVLALKAVCHAHMGRGDEAFRIYEVGLRGADESGPQRWEAAEQIAEADLRARKYDRAEGLYRELIGGGAEEARVRRALVGLAWAQHGQSDDQSAEATLAEALEGAKGSESEAEALYLRGRVLREQGKGESACRDFERLLHDHAQSEYGRNATWELGQLYEKLGLPEKAVATYERLVSLDLPHKRLPDALYALAWIRLAEGNAEEAASGFREIFTQHHGSRYWAHAGLSLAQHEFDAGHQAEAEEILEKLLSDATSNTMRDRALYLSGQIAFAAGDWRKSRQLFERLAKKCPESELMETAAFATAEAAFHEQAPDSIDLFENLLAKDANLASTHRATIRMRLAQLYAESERWNDALAMVESSAEKDPEFAQQYELDYVRGRCLAARALFAQAREAYENVIQSPAGENTETAAKAQLMIGETYFHQRRYEDAYRAYMQVEILYDYPELQSAALLQAGKCQELLGNASNATEVYRLMLENYAGTVASKRAASKLNRKN